MHCSTKKKKNILESNCRKFYVCRDGCFLLTSPSSYREKKNTKMNLIVESSIGRKKKIVPRSAINYVLFSKSNQGHPDDKRCNKYTLFKDILDTANCLIS